MLLRVAKSSRTEGESEQTGSGSEFLWATDGAQLRVGRVVAITNDGAAMVDFPGSPTGVVFARSTITMPADSTPETLLGLPVLLMLERGDSALPVIVGIVRHSLIPEKTGPAAPDKGLAARVDGHNVLIHATNEILLECGRSSILLRRDGKVILKGTQIVSRASGRHKIKGATVQIN